MRYWVALLFLFVVGCGQGDKKAEVGNVDSVKITENDPIKRGVIALDAIYASEQAFQQLGMPAIQTIVKELQAALIMWTEVGDGEGVDACRMAIRIQATYMLDVMDRIDAPADTRSSDFRLACRKAVSYVYDDARIHHQWDVLTNQHGAK